MHLKPGMLVLVISRDLRQNVDLSLHGFGVRQNVNNNCSCSVHILLLRKMLFKIDSRNALGLLEYVYYNTNNNLVLHSEFQSISRKYVHKFEQNTEKNVLFVISENQKYLNLISNVKTSCNYTTLNINIISCCNNHIRINVMHLFFEVTLLKLGVFWNKINIILEFS